MNIEEIVQNPLMSWGGLLMGVMTLVQVAPIEIRPWSWLAKKIGRAINGEVLKKLGEVERRLDKHIVDDDRRTADSSRTRILHFNNELLRDLPNTKEEFIEVWTEIDAYEKYCREDPDYPNNRAVFAIKNIQETYKRRLDKHDFL